MPADKYERLEQLTVDGASPDGVLRLVIRQGPTATLTARSAAIRGYDVRRFEQQLTALLGSAFGAYIRARGEIRQPKKPQPGRETGRPRGTADGPNATGTSNRGWLRLGSRGLIVWRCRLAENTMDTLGGDDLVTEAQSAIDAVLADFATAQSRLRRERFRHDSW